MSTKQVAYGVTVSFRCAFLPQGPVCVPMSVKPSLLAGTLGNSGASIFRRFYRRMAHVLSYHFVLKQPWTRISHTAGFRIQVPPTVFHPGIFLTGKFFASFIDHLDFTDKQVAEVGTGSGILALAAARAGAKRVIATDINPAAARAVALNARANGCYGKVVGLCCNLLTAVAARPVFDVIISSPPSFAGEPRDLADRAWHAGPGYRDIAGLFEQARERLAADGRMYLLLSSDSDLALLEALAGRAGFAVRLVKQHSILFESFLIYELRTSDDCGRSDVT